MEPTYFTFSPSEMSQDEAYRRARPFLAPDSVIVVTSGAVVGVHIREDIYPPAWGRDTSLVRVNEDGSRELIGYREAST